MERFAFDVKDKVALVTGGAQGLGRNIAEALAQCDARVVVADLEAGQGLAKLSAGKEQGLAYIPADVTDAKSVEACVAEIISARGRLDILINNAGIMYKSPVEEIDLASWQKVIDVNLSGAVICTKAAVPAMKERRWGRIINLSSMQAFMGTPTYSAYTASKAGLSALSKVWAAELVSYGITVNAICPSFVDTPMLDNSVARLAKEQSLSREEAKERFLEQVPQRRLLAPDEIAFSVLFLASSLAQGITGHDLVVAAGCILQ